MDEIVYHEERVTAMRSASGLLIHLPRPNSAQHQLGIIAVLWEICTAALGDADGEEAPQTINIELEDEMSLPMIATISAINAELEQAGHRLSVVDGLHLPPSTIGLS